MVSESRLYLDKGLRLGVVVLSVKNLAVWARKQL